MKSARIATVLAATTASLFFTANSATAESLDFYESLASDLNVVQIYESDELTSEILTNRNGNIIIEQSIGVVLNDNGDGAVLNCADEDYNYISYSSVEAAETGNVIMTYFIYNPDTNFEDDILYRFDYIIDNKTE